MRAHNITSKLTKTHKFWKSRFSCPIFEEKYLQYPSWSQNVGFCTTNRTNFDLMPNSKIPAYKLKKIENLISCFSSRRLIEIDFFFFQNEGFFICYRLVTLVIKFSKKKNNFFRILAFNVFNFQHTRNHIQTPIAYTQLM